MRANCRCIASGGQSAGPPNASRQRATDMSGVDSAAWLMSEVLRPLHSTPGHTQHFTPPCDEQVPCRFFEQLYAPSLQTAVTGGVPLPMQVALAGIVDAAQALRDCLFRQRA